MDDTMNKEDAVEIQARALRAIEELTSVLGPSSERCSKGEYELIKRGVGLSIGRIQTELLDFIYALFPELDHLRTRTVTKLDNLEEP